MPRRRRRTSLSDTGELDFLRRLLPYFRPGAAVIVGPGDDCAVVAVGNRRWLLTTDSLVDDVHFRRDWMTARQLGRKAYLVNASDIAAMGGRPRFCLVSAGAPPSYRFSALMGIHRGIEAAARETGAHVVGGNLSRSRTLFVSVTLIGEAPRRPLLRRGARPGDALFVTGQLGAAALGLRRLRRDAHARGYAVSRFREPPCRLAAGAVLARTGIASAAIDISDGLLRDLGHLCAASGVGARIDLARVPCAPEARRHGAALALHGGEDYELLCAVPPHRLSMVERLRSRLGCDFTQIGHVMPSRFHVRVVDSAGRPLRTAMAGFDHFAPGRRT